MRRIIMREEERREKEQKLKVLRQHNTVLGDFVLGQNNMWQTYKQFAKVIAAFVDFMDIELKKDK